MGYIFTVCVYIYIDLFTCIHIWGCQPTNITGGALCTYYMVLLSLRQGEPS